MGNMDYEALHIFLFPFMAQGHMIPTIDMAKLFASKDVKVTIITTPLNIPLISKAINQSKTKHFNNNIHIQAIKLPCAEVGLPEGCENMDSIPSQDLVPAFFNATKLLQEPLEQVLSQQQPDCIISDFFFPWTADSAAKFGIPRLLFHGISFFSLCAYDLMRLHEPHKNVSSDTELFVIPDLPGEIQMTRLQVPDYFSKDEKIAHFNSFMKEVKESELRSYGTIVNSFYELEQVYADYFRDGLGRRGWHIGPFSLCNREREEKAYRGREASIDGHECLKWLDKKEINSVVYVCFGSMANFSDSQLREIATGLEASGQNFIWVVRKKSQEDQGLEWLPEGFEKRMEGKGLIIRGWAPQVLILEHEAIGAFVTHCGWNSTLEGVSAGKPMVTWPLGAEQFYNEKLVTHVLKIGVPVGVKKWTLFTGDTIEWDAIEKSVKRIMVGEEAEDMRLKVKGLAKMARRAVEDGGSSSMDLNALIEELGSLRHAPV